jgi:hypothetical protein
MFFNIILIGILCLLNEYRKFVNKVNITNIWQSLLIKC